MRAVSMENTPQIPTNPRIFSGYVPDHHHHQLRRRRRRRLLVLPLPLHILPLLFLLIVVVVLLHLVLVLVRVLLLTPQLSSSCIHSDTYPHRGVCGALVESTPCVRRIIGSTPALAAT